MADLILLNKTDLVEPSVLNETRHAVRCVLIFKSDFVGYQ